MAMDKEDPFNPSLLQAVSAMTGLRRAEGNALPPPEVLREHQDLWAITLAGYDLLKAKPDTTVIRQYELLPYLRSRLSGDKRSKRVQAAQAEQVDRLREILRHVRREIVVKEGGTYVVRRPKQRRIKPFPALRAFVDCLETKEEALARMEQHRTTGYVLDGHDFGPHQLCSMSCMLEMFTTEKETLAANFNIVAERVHGIPRPISMLHETISGYLPPDRAAMWLRRFYEAIPVGAEMLGCFNRFIIWALKDPAAVRRGAGKKAIIALDHVADLYERKARGKVIGPAVWWEASRAAVYVWSETKGRGFLPGKAAEAAALLQYDIEKGLRAELIRDAEKRVASDVLGVGYAISRTKAEQRRLAVRCADALIRIVST